MRKGRITIPTDENYVEGTLKIAELWGADAVRDCDGTHLPKNAKDLAEKVYNTYFVVRGDNAWADKHTDELQSVLLMRFLSFVIQRFIQPLYFLRWIQIPSVSLVLISRLSLNIKPKSCSIINNRRKGVNLCSLV